MTISKEEQKVGLARIQGVLVNPKAQDMIRAVLPEIVKAYLTPERITKIVLTAGSRDPKLAISTPASILRAIMETAPLGLEIGGPQEHVYLVAFYNSRIGAHEAVPIPGYRGYIALAYRAGEVQSVCTAAIHEGDVFKHVRHAGGDEFIHERKNTSDKIIGYYCRAIYKNGGGHVEHMYLDEIEKHRQRSRAKDSGPWVTDPDKMGRKTTVRQARNYWPQTLELAMLANLDNRVDTGEYVDAGAVIEATAVEKDKPATAALADKIENITPDPAPEDDPPMPPDPEETEAQAPPAEANGNGIPTERKPRTYTHIGDDAKKADFIMNHCIEEAQGDTAKAAEILVDLTTFKGRDKSMVPGVDSCHKLSPKRLAVTFSNIERLIEKSDKKKAEAGNEAKAKGEQDSILF